MECKRRILPECTYKMRENDVASCRCAAHRQQKLHSVTDMHRGTLKSCRTALPQWHFVIMLCNLVAHVFPHSSCEHFLSPSNELRSARRMPNCQLAIMIVTMVDLSRTGARERQSAPTVLQKSLPIACCLSPIGEERRLGTLLATIAENTTHHSGWCNLTANSNLKARPKSHKTVCEQCPKKVWKRQTQSIRILV